MKLPNLHSKALQRQLSKYTQSTRISEHQADRWLVFSVILLSLLGILMVFDSSGAIGTNQFSDALHYVKEQAQGFILGLIALGVLWKLDYHKLYPLAIFAMFGVLVLLFAVFLPGIGVRAYGANRWINLGFINLQPSEFAKISIVLYLSAWFSTKEKGRLTAFLILTGSIVGLVAIQPDMGTALIILGIALSIYFYSGAPIKQFALLIPILVVILTVVIVAAPYRMARVTTFLNPDYDPLGSSYQVRQALLALGSGGWFGTGVGQSRQKYQYLPEANTDAIFAIVGEELGFIGAVCVLGLYMFLMWRGLRISRHAPDMFGKLLAGGITTWVGVQSIINIGALVALLPFTGVPLPFISFGSSSLVVLLSSMGILLNISKQWKQ